MICAPANTESTAPARAALYPWSWYTGAAAWLYRVAVESILGLRLHGTRAAIEPRIPASWPSFTLTFRHHSAVYRVTVERFEWLLPIAKNMESAVWVPTMTEIYTYE